ncbi:M20 metallopeptidase family protein [Ornithinimicrobium sp. W1665]|uniref:M20 metallopeptidase family protein n=1 Tax=Ornithinimicrobium sp. W1665 TaxID=3416666 RepID=UPI003D6AAA03
MGGDEQGTALRVLDLLGESDPVRIKGGFLVWAGGGQQGPAVALRSELDALPIQEDSNEPWRSTVPGVAHLCGHDVHTAALVAVLGTVQAIGTPVPLIGAFQPREEVYPSGAKDFVSSPALAGKDIRAMIGVHLQPMIAAGTFSAVAGPINAASDNFDLRICGVPSHAAYPHRGRDPIVAAAAVIQALQHVVSRRVDPMSPSVVSVGRVIGGDSHNAIPEEVLLQGTVRTFSEDDRRLVTAAIAQVAEGVAAAHGCTANCRFEWGEPVLENDHRLAHLVTRALEDHGLAEADPVRSCGADDFAWYGSLFPSLMIFAGIGEATSQTPGLHHPRFVPADDAVDTVATIMLVAYLSAAQSLTSTTEATHPPHRESRSSTPNRPQPV